MVLKGSQPSLGAFVLLEVTCVHTSTCSLACPACASLVNVHNEINNKMPPFCTKESAVLDRENAGAAVQL